MRTSAARTWYLLVSITAESLICVAASAQGVVPGAPGPTSRNDFPTQAEAVGHCGGRPVIWVFPRDRSYFIKGDPEYGAVEGGAYMCEDEAQGDQNRRASGTPRPPH